MSALRAARPQPRSTHYAWASRPPATIRICQRCDHAQRRAVHVWQCRARVNVARGQAIFRSLADVAAKVLATLSASISTAN